MERFDAIISFDHISFKYKEDDPFVLNDVSFSIPKGKWTSIVGHNGSGKSTLTKLIMGIEQPHSGEIYYKTQPISKTEFNKMRQHIGIVFQNPDNQFVGSIVEYDVAFGLENQQMDYETMHRVVPKVLEDVDMQHYAQAEPQSLSGGQKQRVAIAGIALNTEVIILDEATSMLDPKGRKDLLALIKQLQIEKDVTIISITHDLSEVVEADYMIALDHGTIYETGTPQSVFNSGKSLEAIGLSLPFAMRMNRLLGRPQQYVTFDELVKVL